MSTKYSNHIRVCVGDRSRTVAAICVTRSYIDGSVESVAINAISNDPMLCRGTLEVSIERRDLHRKTDEFTAIAISDAIAMIAKFQERTANQVDAFNLGRTICQGIAALLDEYHGSNNDPVTRTILANHLRDCVEIHVDDVLAG